MDTTDSFHNMMLHLSVDAFLLPAGEQSKVVKGISQGKCAVQRNSITRFVRTPYLASRFQLQRIAILKTLPNTQKVEILSTIHQCLYEISFNRLEPLNAKIITWTLRGTDAKILSFSSI